MDQPLHRMRRHALHRPTPFRSPCRDEDAFAAFMAHDYGRRRRLHPDVAWEDACRAYAFAAASHADLAGRLDLEAELALEDRWERLSGDAGPAWPVARTLLRETWRWLDEHPEMQARRH